MPKPIQAGQRYMPGLDGLRAVAVLAVIAYHEQFGWAPGGLLGVGVFFTLSGYLITGLLLGQWSAHGRINLGDFWIRRARRLLPALFVMLMVVTAWVTIADRARLTSLRGALAAAATYSSNWYLIVQNQSYFARFAPPAPLDHLWSLAVEEQFYVIWPPLLLLALLLLRKRTAHAARWLALPTLAMAAASAIAMMLMYQPGLDPTRVYEGTDTRAFGLLIGAALAMLWPSRDTAIKAMLPRVLLDGAGFAGLAVIGLMIWRLGQYSPFAYHGGMVLLSLATAAAVAAAAVPGSVTGRALGWRPLRWIGARSYGIYLWHYPVIVLTSPANTGEDLPRAALQIAASIGLAALSWKFIEEPVRHGAIEALWKRARATGWRLRPVRLGATVAAAGSAGVLLVACAGITGAIKAPAGTSGSPAAMAAGSALPAVTKSVTHAGPHQVLAGGTAGRASASPGGPLRTSCRAVVHIGDSTSEGMVSPDYLPDAAERLPERYEDVGVQTVITNITGARSVVEVLPGTVNGYNAARALVAQGFRGCWVLALGTNDTADIAAGSTYSITYRIQRMMSVANGEPVMWINLKSLLVSGPYAEANMLKWNAALLRACSKYPNMRVFDWAAMAKPGWFISDGIHYTSAGYAVRSEAIADALARAFPQNGKSSGCLVS
ncbi:MAG: acyltransferase family protein [Streptosporangiaceae bacterium]|jgi:peptidoglycan/LPS O-acetylase OafA/YrhL/lysophospholipase L1-like esterase